MPSAADNRACFAHHAAGAEIIAHLQFAIDGAHARVVRAARMRWDSNFARLHEPSDDIVSVRVTTGPRPHRGSGFLRPHKHSPRARLINGIHPRFAD